MQRTFTSYLNDPSSGAEEFNRVDWPARICFQAFGLRVGIRVNHLDTLDRVYACLPVGSELRESPFVDALFSVRVRAGGNCPLLHCGLRTAPARDNGELFDLLEQELQTYVGEWARERVFVHAGVVGWRGRAILLPGRTMTGKSTLVAALLRAGATYYSDEFAVLDARGTVYPYPRLLSLRQANGSRPHRCPAAALGAVVGREPLPVGLIAMARYRPGAHWQPRTLGPGAALLEVLNHALPARTRPEHTLTALEQALPSALLLKGIRGDADETAQQLLAAFTS